MKSMTGYGRGETKSGHHGYTVEVTSLNRRNLDLTLSIPRDWQPLEYSISRRMRARVQRGKVHISVKVEDERSGGRLEWDDQAIGEVLARLQDVADSHGIPFEVKPDLLYRIASDAGGQALLPPLQDAEGPVHEALDQAVNAMISMREQEGAAMRKDLLERSDALAGLLRKIKEAAKPVAGKYRDALMTRLRQAGLELDPDDERVLKEIAIFADRCDISEEVTRLRSHLEQFSSFLNADEPSGRRFEFLLQEMHREFNTVGSKANDIRLSRHVMEAKNEIERIREQIQNVE